MNNQTKNLFNKCFSILTIILLKHRIIFDVFLLIFDNQNNIFYLLIGDYIWSNEGNININKKIIIMCDNNLDLARSGGMIKKDDLCPQDFEKSIMKLIPFQSRLERSLIQEMTKEYSIFYEKNLFFVTVKKIPNKFYLSFGVETHLQYKKLLENGARDANLFRIKQFCENKSIEIWKAELGNFIGEIVTLFVLFKEQKNQTDDKKSKMSYDTARLFLLTIMYKLSSLIDETIKHQ